MADILKLIEILRNNNKYKSYETIHIDEVNKGCKLRML